MTKVMFICHGNICRSPMAEFVFKDLVEKRGCASEFYIRSCATSTEEIGNPVYPPAKRELARHGIACDGKVAVQLTRADYDQYDRFICMDAYNRRNALRIFGDDPAGKVSMMMDYTDRGGDVADPWYTGDFEVTYRDVLDGCEGLFTSILDNR